MTKYIRILLFSLVCLCSPVYALDLGGAAGSAGGGESPAGALPSLEELKAEVSKSLQKGAVYPSAYLHSDLGFSVGIATVDFTSPQVGNFKQLEFGIQQSSIHLGYLAFLRDRMGFSGAFTTLIPYNINETNKGTLSFKNSKIQVGLTGSFMIGLAVVRLQIFRDLEKITTSDNVLSLSVGIGLF